MIAYRDRRTEGLRWGFEPICRVLRVSPSTIRSHLARPVCARRVADEALKVEIRRVFHENYQVYGVRKIRAVLSRHGHRVSKNRVARLMRELGIRGAVRGRRHRTTISDAGHVRAADLVNRVFWAPAPNRLWVMDFTYVPTWAGMAYVAFVIDVYSRMIVGWHLATNMRVGLVMTALAHAIWRRDMLLDELVAHSDGGSRYTAYRFTDRLVEIGARPSIGSIGDSYDNALAETTIGLYKTELAWRQGPWRTAEELELATLLYIEWFNTRSIHGELGDRSPAEFEADHYRQHRESIATP